MEKVKLLLTDDEECVRNAIAKIVDWDSVGAELCGTAKDGADALDKIMAYEPDILLIDIRMPKMSGLEVIEEINRHEEWHIKSIVLSGHDEFDYARQALRLGAVDYLLKPCLQEDILKAVENARALLMQEKQMRSGKEQKEEKTGHHLVDTAIAYIKQNFRKEISLASTAEEIMITAGYLSTLFKQHTGKSFVDYLNQYRLEQACKLLKNSLLKNYEIAYAVGFNDERYFTRMFKKYYEVCPSDYRNKEL